MTVLRTIILGCLALTQMACAGALLGNGQAPVAVSSSADTEIVRGIGDVLRPVFGTDIRVTSYRGQVILRGAVDSNALRSRAAELARTVKGVRSVDNRLQAKQ